jgi:hypothetical protein
MRIVLVDDVAVQVEEIKRAVQRAGLNISEQDCLHFPTSTKTQVQKALLKRLRSCPAPDLLLVHSSALAGNQQDALSWLTCNNTSPTTLVLAYSGAFRGIRKQQDHQHLWTVGDRMLIRNLCCFLVTSQPYWSQGWPAGVPVELLHTCDWQLLATKHLAALCNELSAIAALADGCERLEKQRLELAERFGELRDALTCLQACHAPATTTQFPAIRDLLAALTHTDPCASADAWEFAMDEFGSLLSGQPAQAKAWVVDLQQASRRQLGL